MDNSENKKFRILSIVLLAGIVGVVIFGVVPKYFPNTQENTIERIDFSNSAWIEQYFEDQVGLFGKDFFITTAFSYNPRSNKMVATYASQNTVEEARQYFLALPGAELTGRNDETSLNITAVIDGQELEIYNYYSSVSRVFELAFTLDAGTAEQVIQQLQDVFPAGEAAKISEIQGLVAGDVFGGYVRYQYDVLDSFAHPNLPIFSRAYIFDGAEEDLNIVIERLNEAYTNKYDETQSTRYYKIDGQIVSISLIVTDLNEKIVSISFQDDNFSE